MDLPLVRSKKILRHARGQPCTLRFPGVCNGNPETTVACHIRDRHKGIGQKASDYSVVFGCSACHRALDEGDHGGDWETITRALQETWGILIRDKIIIVPQDVSKPFMAKPAKPRKPPEQRAPVQHSQAQWPSRPFSQSYTPNVKYLDRGDGNSD